MAFNYFPMSYTPYQQIYQPVQQPAQQPFQQSGIIWISGEKEAAMYPVAPNNAVTLWSQSEPVVYLKQADASGKPTIKTYELVERTETAPNAANPANGKAVTYATKDELDAVMGAINGIDGTIGAIKADIETMRGDLYGIAGKKKKKAEVEADE